MDYFVIGNFIAAERKKRQLTQQQLADRLNVSNKTVSKWECGRGLPDISVIQPLCKELELDVSELLAGKRLDSVAMKKQAEEILLEQMELQQRSKRSKIRILYGAVTISAVAMSLVIYVVAKYTTVLPDTVKGILIVFFGWVMGIAIFTTLYQEHKNALYQCPDCETSFQPSVIRFIFSPKKMNDRWLKCPNCHKVVRCRRHF